MSMWIIWLVAGILLIIAEMLTLSFYMLWIGIGALVAAAIAFFLPDVYLWQVIIGGIVVIVLTVFTRPLTRKVRHSKGFKDAIDELVGKQGEVIRDIETGSLGIVKIGNETWSASADDVIAEGKHVIVIERSSAVVKVKRMEEM
ncbi:NfeD family protein [Paenibacillus albiflavus]|uniref:NfeD family protein n=1 Tax=Paenibacillus albiflavus TaxID=2545760 RepID=A0A4R4EBU8_9BACL|nr:NfeD family protein [Paenibacillus albiflavus]TCZ77394.1 NfeD family protein [Paenibacillus albiflavus]